MCQLSKVLFFLLLMLGSIAHGQYLTGDNGVKYFYWRENKQPLHARVGDLVFVHMVGKTDKDSAVISSYFQGDAFQIFVPKPTYHGCFYEMLTMMGENDSAEVSVIADSLFIKSLGSPLPYFIAPGSKFRITLKMVSIITREEYDKRITEEAKYADQNQKLEIEKYITENHLQMTKTESGIYYQFPLKGFTRRALIGDSVIVHYSGYFLNGKVFDSSVERNEPFAFKLGTEAIIKGWNEALQLMSIRDRMLIILPYQLAYGEKGGSTIPPFTPLIFEIELLDIK